MIKLFYRTTSVEGQRRFFRTIRLCLIVYLLHSFIFVFYNPCAASSFNNKNANLEQKDKFDLVRPFIPILMKKYNLPSVSVAVAKDSQIIWEEAFGWAPYYVFISLHLKTNNSYRPYGVGRKRSC